MGDIKGVWIKRYRYGSLWYFRCSDCQKTCPQSNTETPTFPYCPHCAKPKELEVCEK